MAVSGGCDQYQVCMIPLCPECNDRLCIIPVNNSILTFSDNAVWWTTFWSFLRQSQCQVYGIKRRRSSVTGGNLQSSPGPWRIFSRLAEC